MKAFLSRLHIGGSAKDKDRDPPPPIQKEKFPPLRQWPPPEQQRSPPSATTTTTYTAFKPLPEIIPSQLSSQFTTRPLPPIDEPVSSLSPKLPDPPSTSLSSDFPLPEFSRTFTSPAPDIEPPPQISRKGTNTSVNSNTTVSDAQKKVAFIQPTPTTPISPDSATPSADPTSSASATPPAPVKTTLTRFQATHAKEPRGSVATATTSTAASSSKTDIATRIGPKAASVRAASPYLQKAPDTGSLHSIRSPTPYSHMSSQTTGSRILAAQSWSEVTEEDLVSNIGSRERTRQEVLFEIISSEERYLHELIKMKETFIDPLLHPYSTNIRSATASPVPNVEYDFYRSDSPVESLECLPPIAARFMSPLPTSTSGASTKTASRQKEAPLIEAESIESEEEVEDQVGRGYPGRDASKHNHPQSPYRLTIRPLNKPVNAGAVPFPSKSHPSLPPTGKQNQLSSSTTSLGRQSTVVEKDKDRDRKYSQGPAEVPQKPGVLRKLKKSQTTPDSVLGSALPPHHLPEDFRICLEVIDGGVFDGHKKLSEALKKRYDDQFPLVRSLADVFVIHHLQSDIFRGYATYVLHLERALEQVDAALSNTSNKKPSKQDAGEWQRVCSVLQKLENVACDKGETGLAITLSKPFQRLLKYPLLFQNLLFHTDPSTFEYETTLQMVAEIEAIVRSIEDEKIQKEERDKTRDVFARIEGLDKVKQLALPKPSRVLVEERPYLPGPSTSQGNGNGSSSKPLSPPPVINGKGVKGKSSLKRLSDVLTSGSHGIGGKKELWHVVFNDVVLLCQRVGSTSLPLVASTNSRTNSLPELQGKAKYATTGRRNSHAKPRNLYKFIKIETWAIGDVVQPKEGVVAMDEVARSRAQALSSQPRIVPLPDDDEDNDDDDSDDSDKKSKMSFSYWGADKMTVVQRPILKTRMGANPRRGLAMASYQRVSSANAKFGTRLVSDSHSSVARPGSRRAMTASPAVRRPPPSSDEGPSYARSTATKPAWDQGTRTTTTGQSTAVSASLKSRTRNTSQTSAATRTTANASANAKGGLASPAPSTDSGVGLYGQIIANGPELSQT
ncbi:hypothetical protein AMATHDRAFT_47686 [Amanita thiersii Skay4041]|uniref:DH domain-containing protein n=1 Tax=Amanita thiersii Skay4041 TaxID=703135 RepID=A0A2A9NQX3_9AGAR|nr:hypothetical protein AMATHDRAFT_47686 [Amanita thiersii Skay4041]